MPTTVSHYMFKMKYLQNSSCTSEVRGGCLTCDHAHQQAAHDGGHCAQQAEVEVGQRVPGVRQSRSDADTRRKSFLVVVVKLFL